MKEIEVNVSFRFIAENDSSLAEQVREAMTQAAAKAVKQSDREDDCLCNHPESDDIVVDVNGNRIGTITVSRETV